MGAHHSPPPLAPTPEHPQRARRPGLPAPPPTRLPSNVTGDPREHRRNLQLADGWEGALDSESGIRNTDRLFLRPTKQGQALSFWHRGRKVSRGLTDYPPSLFLILGSSTLLNRPAGGGPEGCRLASPTLICKVAPADRAGPEQSGRSLLSPGSPDRRTPFAATGSWRPHACLRNHMHGQGEATARGLAGRTQAEQQAQVSLPAPLSPPRPALSGPF